LLTVSGSYGILCSQYSYLRLKNATVHAVASVNMKDETWSNDFDAPHDALDDDIDTNNWSVVEETAIAHDTCMDQDTDTVMGEMQLNQKRMVLLNLNNAFRIPMIFCFCE